MVTREAGPAGPFVCRVLTFAGFRASRRFDLPARWGENLVGLMGTAAQAGAGSAASSGRHRPARADRGTLDGARAGSPRGVALVGRREELQALEDEYVRAAAGEFRFVLLQGEGGLGKTRLARELLRDRRDAIGLFARGYPLAASAAFGLWAEAVDPFLQSLADHEVVELCGGALDDLASVFSRVAAVRGSVPGSDPPLPRLLQGLTRLLGRLSERAPLVVVLDDVHFADASSWEGLRYFARHLDATRLLIVATSRPAELAEHDVAAQVLFELDEDDLLSRIELGALDRPGLEALSEAVIEQPAPAVLVDWVSERSRGNPLYAIGLLRALLDEAADLSAPQLRRLPEGLTERVTAELRRFDATQRALLELLAVVGRPVSLGGVVALTGSSVEVLRPALSELVQRRIVLEEERGSELDYELQHPLVRDVIYQATGGAGRRVLHRQAGRALLASGHPSRRRRFTWLVRPSGVTRRRSRFCWMRCGRLSVGRRSARRSISRRSWSSSCPTTIPAGWKCSTRCLPEPSG